MWARKTTNHSYTPLITCMTHGSGTYYITGSWTSVPNTSYVTIQRRLWVKKFHWCPSCHNQVLAGSDWHPFRWCWCWTIPKVVFFLQEQRWIPSPYPNMCESPTKPWFLVGAHYERKGILQSSISITNCPDWPPVWTTCHVFPPEPHWTTPSVVKHFRSIAICWSLWPPPRAERP